MVYNINLGIGWASSGVEYAQSYRAVMLRKIGAEAKFIFIDMFPTENIEHMTKNIGFLDSEVMWLYTFFTDTRIAPVSYTLSDVKAALPTKAYTFSREGKRGRLGLDGTDVYYTLYFVDEESDRVHRIEMVAGGCLIRKDYYTYTRIYSEYYAPLDNSAHMYLRRFFNEDGTVAYEEINDDGQVMYQFPDKLICSKEELVGYMVSKMNLTAEDTVIIDRSERIGQAVLMNVGQARVGVVVHADHFSEGSADDGYILWNNYYEYDFAMNGHMDFYVTSTDNQTKLLKEQFEEYNHVSPVIYTIPVGSLDALKYPAAGRKPYSVITASRLASEKHVDWAVEAVAKAHEKIPQITFDIYGVGSEEEKIRNAIKEHGAEDYITLRGQCDMKEVYQDYELYLSASTSEGFGLSLMEAVGGGLPIIGFDVRYGNPTFVDDRENGYLITLDEHMPGRQKIGELADCIVRLFTEADLERFHRHSYEKAEGYLTEEVAKRWEKVIE